MKPWHQLALAAVVFLAAATGAAGQPGSGAPSPEAAPAADNGTLSRQKFLTICVPMWRPLSICDPAQPPSEPFAPGQCTAGCWGWHIVNGAAAAAAAVAARPWISFLCTHTSSLPAQATTRGTMWNLSAAQVGGTLSCLDGPGRLLAVLLVLQQSYECRSLVCVSQFASSACRAAHLLTRPPACLPLLYLCVYFHAQPRTWGWLKGRTSTFRCAQCSAQRACTVCWHAVLGCAYSCYAAPAVSQP